MREKLTKATQLAITKKKNTTIYDTEEAINLVLSVKKFLVSIPALYEALATARTDLLCAARVLCRAEAIDPISNLISTIVNPDATYARTGLEMRNQRMYCVKVCYPFQE